MPRRVLVTGSSRGIGRAIAAGLARDGFDVTVHCRTNTAEAQTLLDAILAGGGTGRMLQFDVCDRARCRALLEAEIAKHGAFYGVVLNAGINRDAPFTGFEEADWDNVLRTDLDSFFNVLQPLILPMLSLKDGGRIVTMSSIAGINGNRGQVNYSAAKAGLIGATKALAKELAKRRVSVNSVAPGWIETDMLKGIPLDEVQKTVPMGRLGRPEEVAALVQFLFSPAAEYISGQVISINGALM